MPAGPVRLEPVRGRKDYIDLFLETLLPLLRQVHRMLVISEPLRVAADLKNLAQIRSFVLDRLTTLGVPEDLRQDVQLAVDEAASKSISHGYRGREGFIEIEIWREGGALAIRLSDEAELFDPTKLPPRIPACRPKSGCCRVWGSISCGT